MRCPRDSVARSALRQLQACCSARCVALPQEITQSELRSVVSALVSADPRLAEQGWTRQGHFFEW